MVAGGGTGFENLASHGGWDHTCVTSQHTQRGKSFFYIEKAKYAYPTVQPAALCGYVGCCQYLREWVQLVTLVCRKCLSISSHSMCLTAIKSSSNPYTVLPDRDGPEAVELGPGWAHQQDEAGAAVRADQPAAGLQEADADCGTRTRRGCQEPPGRHRPGTAEDERAVPAALAASEKAREATAQEGRGEVVHCSDTGLPSYRPTEPCSSSDPPHPHLELSLLWRNTPLKPDSSLQEYEICPFFYIVVTYSILWTFGETFVLWSCLCWLSCFYFFILFFLIQRWSPVLGPRLHFKLENPATGTHTLRWL